MTWPRQIGVHVVGVMPMGLLIFMLIPGLAFAMGLFAATLAWVKGYRPWFWLVSMGPIGAVLMLIKPNLNRAQTPEEREQWEARADWTGGILSGITLFFSFAVPILLFGALFSYRGVAVAPPTFTVRSPAATEVMVDEPVDSPMESQDEQPATPSEPAAKPLDKETDGP
jgi:hypothetical protein